VAFHRLKRFQISRLPVVSRLDDKRIVGVITAQDIVNKFGYELTESTKEDDQDIEDLEIT
ncbi:CBS domain-containing protein, partial [Halobacteriovorax sp.]|uniref:CBS domain-containing protein n=1 Tax=Halobacteriovorax sp. TaxID=2020862 RepID=UPI003569220A